MPINGNWHITTATENYAKCYQPFLNCGKGGIQVYPQLDIQNISEGHLIFNQIVLNHKLIIKKNGATNEYSTDTSENYKDTREHESIYSRYFISKNRILYQDKNNTDRYKGFSEIFFENPNNFELPDALFYDAPFMGLLNDWEEWEYYIKFQTWIQYIGDLKNPQICPVCSFDWWLDAKAERDSSENWILTKNVYSTINEIKQSIQYPTQPLLIEDSYLQISEEVKKWREANGLW
jgi:hypothetical protein